MRYYGWYSNRSRGERKLPADGQETVELSSAPDRAGFSEAVDAELSRSVCSRWARLLRKVCEVEPLSCPHCGEEMRFLAVIEQAPVIEWILRHVGMWEPTPPLRAPPEEGEWPTQSQIPLTYHPVPGIA